MRNTVTKPANISFLLSIVTGELPAIVITILLSRYYFIYRQNPTKNLHNIWLKRFWAISV